MAIYVGVAIAGLQGSTIRLLGSLVYGVFFEVLCHCSSRSHHSFVLILEVLTMDISGLATDARCGVNSLQSLPRGIWQQKGIYIQWH